MKLYSGPLSLFSAKARIVLGEKDLAHELIQVAWSRAAGYEPRHPDVLALNPKGQVPVLVDGDAVVYDSTLIAEYLEDRHPEPRLFPTDPVERARCRLQEAAADEIWFPHLWTLIQAGMYGRADAMDGVPAAVGALGTLWRGFDAGLGAHDYWCDRFSVADVGSLVFVTAAGTLGAPLPDDLTRMHAWRARCAARPAVRAVLADMTAFAARAMAA
jgi:glutathione S-transferase